MIRKEVPNSVNWICTKTDLKYSGVIFSVGYKILNGIYLLRILKEFGLGEEKENEERKIQKKYKL